MINPEDLAISDFLQFEASSVEPFDFDNSTAGRHAVEESLDIVKLSSDQGQIFTGLYLNRDSDSDTAVVRLHSFQSSSTTRQQKYTAYQFAAALPDRKLVALDLPGHGRSDQASWPQLRQMVGRKSLSLVAEAQASAIERYLPDTEKFILVGDSMGGTSFYRRGNCLEA